jgi:DNA replication licensing factor MCM5
MEKAIKEVCFELSVNYKSVEDVPDFQFLLKNYANPRSLRDLTSANIGQLVVIHGIIVSASKPQIKASQLVVQCRACGNIKSVHLASNKSGNAIPRICDSTQGQNKEKCPLDSYVVVPEKCVYADQQTLKIQEAPEMIPTGEVPRSYLINCDKSLVNKVTPGTRLTVVGILNVNERKEKGDSNNFSARSTFIKSLGFQLENQKSGKFNFNFTEEDEKKFISYSKDPKIYEKISNSIASAIYGSEEIKKAIACLLFGGVRKKLSEGVNLRGDINILLIGDPSTAKSQFLKFVERVAPISVYTSGKGSSAAGLTASIIRDQSSGEFQLEGGAMVLADGGIVCIDEFDKMRSQDRVAIHEAMEQQTISVAKAGITTTLNSRTSVLAAANPIYGRLDDLKSTQEQIDFQTTILSRFDCIFLVKDVRDVNKDIKVADHVFELHMNGKISEKENESEIHLEDLKKYIAYAKMKSTPRLSPEAGELLKNFYVQDRKTVNENKKQKKKNTIPVTVRQLEAIIRLSEAIAKMSLSNTVTENNVKEAHRLFQISTLKAASSGYNLSCDISPDMAPVVLKVEEAIRRRLAIGSKVGYQKLVEELILRFNSERPIEHAIITMIKRDELKYLEARKIIQRMK